MEPSPYTTVHISRQLKTRLERLKIHRREPLADVIERFLPESTDTYAPRGGPG